MTARRLTVAPEVAQHLPAAHLAQMQAQIDDPDNRCGVCGGTIDGPAADVVLFIDGDLTVARVTHPACATSGIYDLPGLRAAEAERLANGLNLTVLLARRPTPTPRAIVFIELLDAVSLTAPNHDGFLDEDPVADYAAILGLHPITGALEQITPSPTTLSRLQITGDRLTLVHPRGQDLLWAEASETLTDWAHAAAEDYETALIITARGLGLSRDPPPIAWALARQPTWGAQVTVDGLERYRR